MVKAQAKPASHQHTISNPTFSVTGALGPINNRNLSIKQLRDTIQDIYSQKIKFDKKCEDSKQSRETME